MNRIFPLFSLLSILLAKTFPISAQINSPISLELNSVRPGSKINSLSEFHFTLPVFISKKNKVVFSPQYKVLNTEDIFSMDYTHFYSASGRLVWQHKINERWSSVLLTAISLGSANKDFSAKGLTWFSGLRLMHIQSTSFRYYLGFAYTYRFSNHIILPLLEFKWKPAPDLTVTGNLPLRSKVEWTPNSKIITGLFFRGERFSAHIPSGSNLNYLWFRERNIGWDGSIKTFRNFCLTTEIGYSLKRDLNIYTEPEKAQWSFASQFLNPKEYAVFEHNEKGIYAKFGITYRIHKDE